MVHDRFPTIKLTLMCARCGHFKTTYVSRYQYEEYEEGTPIKQALPGLSFEEQVMLEEGLCVDCSDCVYQEPL